MQFRTSNAVQVLGWALKVSIYGACILEDAFG
jgi:hypothetical protein